MKINRVFRVENLVSVSFNDREIKFKCPDNVEFNVRSTTSLPIKNDEDPIKFLSANPTIGILCVYFPKYDAVIQFEHPVTIKGNAATEGVILLYQLKTRRSTWNTFLRQMRIKGDQVELGPNVSQSTWDDLIQTTTKKRKSNPAKEEVKDKAPTKVTKTIMKRPPKLGKVIKDDSYGGSKVTLGTDKVNSTKLTKGTLVTTVQYEKFDYRDSYRCHVQRCGQGDQSVTNDLFDTREVSANQYSTSIEMTKQQIRQFASTAGSYIFRAVFLKQPNDEDTAKKLLEMKFNPEQDELAELTNKVSHAKTGEVRIMDARLVDDVDRKNLNDYHRKKWMEKYPSGLNKQGKPFTPKSYKSEAGFLQVVDMQKMSYGTKQTHDEFMKTMTSALRVLNLQTLFMVIRNGIRAYDKNFEVPQVS